MHAPGISNREFVFYGFGINNLRVNKSFLILCQSIDGLNILKSLQKPTKGLVRAKINIFGFEVEVLSLSQIRIRGLMEVDPNISFIPQWLIDYSSKFVGV